MQRSIILSRREIPNGSDDLIPIGEIIRRGRAAGLSFGFGDPKIHLAYLTRIRLLPQTQRRKIGGKIVGCYPEIVIQRLREIEEMKTRGMTYAQMRREFEEIVEDKQSLRSSLEAAGLRKLNIGIEDGPWKKDRSFATAFLIIGILLGYLLAINNRFNPDGQKLLGPESATIIPASENMRVASASRASTDSEPIYIIAVPRGNFEKLGSTKINLSY